MSVSAKVQGFVEKLLLLLSDHRYDLVDLMSPVREILQGIDREIDQAMPPASKNPTERFQNRRERNQNRVFQVFGPRDCSARLDWRYRLG